ncbi:neprilysin-1-like [Dermacentor albipictus]|uniref:neprilysin-1-like n=1 Tax=Dermacentor albipictus TaxID=60249 RepID=UPI0031FD151C
MAYSPSDSSGRRNSSISPVISNYVLTPEETRRPSRLPNSASSPKKLRKRSSPLIHHYRLATTDSPIRLRRCASVKKHGSRFPRSVSFHAPVRLRTVSESDVKISSVTPPPPVDRSAEYRVFLVSMTAVTLAFTVLQPLVLFHFLVQCQEPRCYKPAIAIRESIEPSIAPCHDFYKYACSGADSNHYAKARDSVSISVLHSISALPTTSGQSSVEKAAILLRNCMKLVHERPEDIDKIKTVLSAGGFTFPQMPTTSVYFIVRGIVDINLNIGIGPLFRLTAGHNLRLGRGYMLYFAPSYHIVPFVKFLQQLQLANTLDVYVRRCAEVIGERGMSYSRVIRAIQTVNRQFSHLPENDALNAQVKMSSQYPLTEFWFSLSKILGKKFQSLQNVRTTCLVVDGEYAEFLSQNVFASLDPIKISAYVGLYIVWFLSRLASYSLAYSTTVANYTDSLKDLWPRCFSDVRQLMPFAAERLYLKDHLERSDIEHVQDMVQRISHSARNFVTSLHNASQGSETRMVTKIEALRVIPYTFTTTNDIVELDRLYAHVPDQKDANYLDNYLHLTRIIAQHMVSLLVDTEANTTRFFVPPFRVELPNMISVYNTVQLGPDTVVPPIDKSFSLNYAVIGHSVVEQVSQLFLRGPEIFNETGYYDRVWSSGYINALRRRYQCLRRLHVEQRWYSGSIPRRVLEAAVTAEILFDAYKGFRQMPQNAAHFRHEADQFGLTPEQLFFVGLCINWYQRSVEQRGLADRVCRFALPTLRAFGDAFGCAKAPSSSSWDECGH